MRSGSPDIMTHGLRFMFLSFTQRAIGSATAHNLHTFHTLFLAPAWAREKGWFILFRLVESGFLTVIIIIIGLIPSWIIHAAVSFPPFHCEGKDEGGLTQRDCNFLSKLS